MTNACTEHSLYSFKTEVITDYLLLETTLKVKVFAWSPFGDQFFWFRDTFLQFKILGAMGTKMVATWRVGKSWIAK